MLSSDLWAKVFGVLAEEVRSARSEDGASSKEALSRQADLHKLRMVCKQFNSTFQAYDSLSSTLVLKLGVANESRASLLQWATNNAQSVKVFCADCGYPKDRGNMAAAQQGLAPCIVDDFFSCSIELSPPLISNFTFLTSCTVSIPAAHHTDLTVLQTALVLQKLTLKYGKFTCSAMSPHLTSLSLHEAELSLNDDMSGTNCLEDSLQKLQMYNSYLALHPVGTTVYHALQELHCNYSTFASSLGPTLHSGWSAQVSFPVDMTPLLGITALHINFSTAHDRQFDLACLYALTNLRSLSVSASYSNLSVTSGLTALCQLSCLHLEATTDFQVCLLDSPDWPSMTALQKLSIESDSVNFGKSIKGLLDIKALRSIILGSCTPCQPSDWRTAKCFGYLMYHLGRKRPDIHVTLNNMFE